MFVDSHVHLDAPSLYPDLEEVLARAKKARVKSVMTICCMGKNRHSIEATLKLLDKFDCVWAAFGVHPHDAQFFSDKLGSELADLLKHPKALALGEIGLDFHYVNSSIEAQKEAFLAQIELARAACKPIVIHSRKSDNDICSILEQEFDLGEEDNGVIHCFNSNMTIARRCLDLGFYIGLGGILTFTKSDDLRALASCLPADRILIETDSPYLTPVPYRGKTNQPSFVVKVAQELGRIRSKTAEQIGFQTGYNFERLFRIGSGIGDPNAGSIKKASFC